MKKLIVSIITVCFLAIVSCSKSNKFEIEKGKVGEITTKTTVEELKKIFKKDSIATSLSEGALGDNYFQEDDKYLIYEKGGKHLLTITPKQPLDSTSTIKSIEIHDNRYTTETDLNLDANFVKINANNNINKIESTFSTAILFINDFNATVTITKEELGMREFSTQKVSLEQIPDLAKIKTFVIWFN
ncbi:hypothetical protein N9V96_03380 [Polaribacter sp.]|nr:hypothetical protein [Polaribacter sp.]